MSPSPTVRALVGSLLVVAGVGVVDAFIGAEWDLFGLFALLVAITAGLVAHLEGQRPPVPVRRDLVAWLRERSAVSGEPIGAVADRALASYRDRYGSAIGSGTSAPGGERS